MILYQRSNIPFPLRVLGILFHPGLLLVPMLAAGLIYLASRDKALGHGLYVGAGLAILFYAITVGLLIRNTRCIIVAMETINGSLLVKLSDVNGSREFLIPAERLAVNLVIRSPRTTRRRGRSGRPKTLYLLTVKDQNNADANATLSSSAQVVGYILHGLESEKFKLGTKEREFAEQYRQDAAVENLPLWKWMKYAVWLMALISIGVAAYRCGGAITMQ